MQGPNTRLVARGHCCYTGSPRQNTSGDVSLPVASLKGGQQLLPIAKTLGGSSPYSIGVSTNCAGSSFKGSGDGQGLSSLGGTFYFLINSAFPSAEVAVDLPKQTPFFKRALPSVNHTAKVLLGWKGGAPCTGEDGAWLSYSCGSRIRVVVSVGVLPERSFPGRTAR